MRLDWENESEVIKKGKAVFFYKYSNRIAVIGLTALMVFLSMHMDTKLLMLILILITSVLAVLSYMRVMALSK